jgi:drug/metabolite transporter (DMT)-like permease
MNNNKVAPYISLFIVKLLWASNALIIRYIDYPVSFVILFSGIFSLSALIIYIFFANKLYQLQKIKFESLYLVYMMISGIFAIALYYAFADTNFSIGAVSLIINSTPFLIIFLAPLLINEKSTKLEYFFAVITFIGFIVFIYGKEIYDTTNLNLSNIISAGLLFSIVALLLNTILTLLNRKITQYTKSTILIPLFVSFGSILAGLIMIALVDNNYDMTFSNQGLMLNFIQGIIIIFFGYLLVAYSFCYIKVQLISIINLSQPIITSIFGIIFFKESFNILMILGASIVLISSAMIVYISTKKQN